MLKLIVLTTLFFLPLYPSAYDTDMPPQTPEAKLAYAKARLHSEIIDEQPVKFKPARHAPTDHKSKYCHTEIIKKLDQMCPNKCQYANDEWLDIELCQEGMTDLQILRRCCPDRIYS